MRWVTRHRLGDARRRPRGVAGVSTVAALLFVIGAVVPFGAVATASAAGGQGAALTLRECFAGAAMAPCQRVPHRSLEFAGGVVVSPDGTNAYVAARRYRPHGPGIDAITEFTRDADGTLRPVGCLAFDGARGCRASRISLEGASRMAISPDGRDLYALTDFGVVELSREGAGRLRPIGCLSLAPRPGPAARPCARPAATPPLGPTGIALSPDGADLYVTGAMKEKGFPRSAWVGAIDEFARRPDGTVAPTPLGCVGPADAHPCATIAAYHLDDPTLAPDGSALYAVAYEGIWRFPRAADGSLGAPVCVIWAGHGCGLADPGYESLAISPDGSLLYLGTIHDTAAYSIGSTGTLAELVARPFPAERLALSPDGSRLYGSVDGRGGIRAFAAGGGALSALGAPFRQEDVEGMAVTPDGGTLLATTSCGCGGALLSLSTSRKETPP